MSKKNSNKINASTYIRTIYSPGYSYMMMSFYNVNLSFSFCRFIGRNNAGKPQFEKNHLTTSVNYEGAALLYHVIMPILNEANHWDEVKTTVPCNNAALIFEYKPDENNRMAAYITIEKNNQQISLKFPTLEYEYKKDGKFFTHVAQSGLGVLAKTIYGYLTAVGGDRHLNKMPDNSANSQDENQQASYPTGNNGGYQQGFNTMGNNQQGYQQGSSNGYQQRNNNTGYQHGNYNR